MPSIAFISNGLRAVDLYNISTQLSGDEAMFKDKERMRKKLLKTWKELDTENPEEREEEKEFSKEEKEAARLKRCADEQRSFPITPEEQNALAEGFLELMRDKTVKDGQKQLCLSLAKLCKFSGWLDKQIGKKQSKAFTESDEAVETDSDEKKLERSTAEASAVEEMNREDTAAEDAMGSPA